MKSYCLLVVALLVGKYHITAAIDSTTRQQQETYIEERSIASTETHLVSFNTSVAGDNDGLSMRLPSTSSLFSSPATTCSNEHHQLTFSPTSRISFFSQNGIAGRALALNLFARPNPSIVLLRRLALLAPPSSRPLPRRRCFHLPPAE